MRQFAAFQIDEADQRLIRGGDAVPLTPKAFQVLAYLALHAGRLVTAREILDAVWPAQFVASSVVKVCVAEIRKALGDDAQSPTFIANERGRGYRFLSPVTEVSVYPGGTLVGRTGELGQLSAALTLASAGTPHFVFLSGEPGIGKSALVRTWMESLNASAGLRWLEAQCIEHLGEPEPYYPILDALRHAASAWGPDHLKDSLRTHAPAWLKQMPSLLDPAERTLSNASASEGTREQMLREMATAVSALAAQQTLIIVLEDVHWSDRSTFDLLSWLGNERGVSRLLVIATYRAADVLASNHPLATLERGLAARQRLTRIKLGPLDRRHVSTLLAHRYPEHDFPETFADAVHRHAGGNPLFLFSILNDMSARGLLNRHGGRWITSRSLDASQLGVPEDLRSLILMLLGRLSDSERQVLEAASVAGVEFLLSHIAPLESAEAVESTLDSLARRGLFIGCTPSGNGTNSYRFQHSLFREVLYGDIPPTRKRRLHLDAGKLLERVAGDDPDAASQLALHFERGQLYAHAIRYWQLAAQVASSRCAQREALDTLLHAQLLCASLPPEESRGLLVSLLEQQGIVHRVAGEHSKSAEVFEAMLTAARAYLQLGDELMARLWLVAALGDRPARLAHLSRAGELLALENDPARKAGAALQIAYWETVLNDWRPRPEADSAWQTILQSRDRSMAAHVGGRYGFLLCLQTRYAEAIEVTEKSVLAATAANQLASAQITNFFQGWSLLHAGQWGRLGKVIDESLVVAERNGQNQWRLGFDLLYAWLCVYVDAFPWALPHCRQCEASAAGMEHHGTARQLSLLLLGEALTRSGEFEAARKTLDALDAWQNRQRIPMDWIFRIHLHFARAEWNLRQGHSDAACCEANAAIASATAFPEKTWNGLAHWYAARACAVAGDGEGATRHLQLGRGVIAGSDVPIAEWRLDTVAYQVSGAQSDRARAIASATRLLMAFRQDDPLREIFAASCKEQLGGGWVPAAAEETQGSRSSDHA